VNPQTATNQPRRPDDPGRELWLRQRRQGIGASDAAAILGVHPYKTAFDVWLEKTGQVKDRPPTKPMEWGLRLEDAIAQKYSDETGRKLWKPDRIYRHPEHDFICCTPDRLVIGENGVPTMGLELKTADSHVEWKWGELGTDDVPREYIVQCAASMAVLGFDQWDVAVLIGGNDDRIYTIRRDSGFERLLISRLSEWWERYVVKDEMPPTDHGDLATAWLYERHPEKGPRINADEHAQTVGDRLVRVKREIKELEVTETSLRNQLIFACGDAAGIDGHGWRALWCGGNKKSETNWQQLATALMSRLNALGHGEEINTMAAAARFDKETARSFRFMADK